MEKLKELIEKTDFSVTIFINDHRDYYETIEDNIKSGHLEGIDNDVLKKMIELDTCVNIQVYPLSANTFFNVYHYDIDKAIDWALKEIKEYNKN